MKSILNIIADINKYNIAATASEQNNLTARTESQPWCWAPCKQVYLHCGSEGSRLLYIS